MSFTVYRTDGESESVLARCVDFTDSWPGQWHTSFLSLPLSFPLIRPKPSHFRFLCRTGQREIWWNRNWRWRTTNREWKERSKARERGNVDGWTRYRELGLVGFLVVRGIVRGIYRLSRLLSGQRAEYTSATIRIINCGRESTLRSSWR